MTRPDYILTYDGLADSPVRGGVQLRAGGSVAAQEEELQQELDTPSQTGPGEERLPGQVVHQAHHLLQDVDGGELGGVEDGVGEQAGQEGGGEDGEGGLAGDGRQVGQGGDTQEECLVTGGEED